MVVRLEPSNLTTEPEIKLVPLTVKVNSDSPAFFDVGEIEVVVGTGLGAADGENVPISTPTS